MPGMFYLHDYLHTARIAEMARALTDGHFPVRWSENFGYGYGMPLFEFYAPLPFYIGGLLALIGIPILIVTKILFVICNIGTAIGSYFLGKSFYGRVGGLIAAAAITLAPYRAVNLYVRGALSESWGVMAAVWIIYFSFLTAKGHKNAWLGLTAWLVVLFLSHNLLTLIFVPFALVLTLMFLLLEKEKAKKNSFASLTTRSLKIIKAYLLSLGISAFYVFPAFIEKEYTKVEEFIVGGYFDYSLHFLYLRQLLVPNWGYGGSNWGPVDDISFFLGYGQLAALALVILTLVKAAYSSIKQVPFSVTKQKWLMVSGVFLLLIFSLLLTTEKTTYMWQSIAVLQFVQFPWRFLSVAIVLLGVVAPFFLFSFQSFIKRWLVGWIVLLAFFANAIYFKPESQLDDPFRLYTGEIAAIQNELSPVLPDYLPRDAAERTTAAGSILNCQGECRLVTTITDKVHIKSVLVSAASPATISFSINYFPGWLTKLNGTIVETKIANGLVSIDVPQGESEVSAEFGGTQLRSNTDMVSLVSLIIFLVADL